MCIPVEQSKGSINAVGSNKGKIPYCLVLVSSSSRFKRDLHKQTRLFHNRIKINKYKLNYRLYLEGVIGSSWTSVLL